jgi:uncharacterized protein DUF1236
MRNKLLTTVAVAAVVGFCGFAAAQSQMGGESNKATSGATSNTTQEKSGGSMSGTQSGSKTLSPSSTQSSNPSQNQSAQEKSGKDNERLGQGRKEEQKEMTRGAQDQKGGMQQKGAQEQRGTNLKGAQEQRGTGTKGAQEQPSVTGRGTTEQTGQAGVTGGARSGSVQLSEDQRSQIKIIVGRASAPRLSGSVNFDVRVGTRIPRSVRFAVLPEDIVRIIPQYRGFDYFLIGDEIVIVDPRTLEIVAIIPA